MVPSTKVVFPKEDREAILARIDKALQNGFLAVGPNVREFEQRFAAYTGVTETVATSNGGTALEAVFRAIQMPQFRKSPANFPEVIVPANTFAASAMAAVNAGLRVRFVDMSPETMAPTLDHLRQAISPQTVAALIVHVGGHVTPEIEDIRRWCDRTGLYLIEDCAHAHGSEMNGKRAGSFGHAGCFSFFATKVMTSGEGGMVTTNDPELAKAVRLLGDYGKATQWVSYHEVIGANNRMNELEAAVGIVQLDRLDEMIAHREGIAHLYDRLIERDELPVKVVRPFARSSRYKYVILLPVAGDRDGVRQEMEKRGSKTSGGVFDIPLHKQPAFKSHHWMSLPGAEDFCSRHLCLPIYYGMTMDEAHQVYDALKGAMDATMRPARSAA